MSELNQSDLNTCRGQCGQSVLKIRFVSSLKKASGTDSWCVSVTSGVFICRGKEDALVTKNMVIGESVYGEKRINVEVRIVLQHRAQAL